MKVFSDDDSTLHLVQIAQVCKKCEICVEHGLEDLEFVSLSLPGLEIEETEETENRAQSGGLSDIELDI